MTPGGDPKTFRMGRVGGPGPSEGMFENISGGSS